MEGMHGGMEVWRYGGMEVWRYGGMEAWRDSRTHARRLSLAITCVCCHHVRMAPLPVFMNLAGEVRMEVWRYAWRYGGTQGPPTRGASLAR